MSDNKERQDDLKDTSLTCNARQVEGYTDDEKWDSNEDIVSPYISNIKTIALGCLAVIMMIFTLKVLITTVWAA